MEKLLVKIVKQELFQQQWELLLVPIVLLEHIHHQLQYVLNVPQENGQQKDQEVVVIVMQNVEMKNAFKQQENVQVVQLDMVIMQEHVLNVLQDIIQKVIQILVHNVKQEIIVQQEQQVV